MQTVDRGDRARSIRALLGHPVVDADGHWLEPGELFLDYVRELGGEPALAALLAHFDGIDAWYRASPAQRLAQRIVRPGWWVEPADTYDRATAMLPALLRNRLDDLGIDVGIIYPSVGLLLPGLRDAEHRRAVVRAYNTMTADQFRPHRDRLLPVALVTTHTPEEAIELATHAVRDLGFRAIMVSSLVYRDIDTSGEAGAISAHGTRAAGYYVDALAIDSAYDYDRFWQTCIDLKVAVAAHSGGFGWPDRRSPNNYVYNHLGHFAAANDAFCKAMLLGGVLRRFPKLNIACLEGGVAWAAKLHADILSHWNTRSPSSLARNLNPKRLDTAQLRQFIEQWGDDRVRAIADRVIASPNSLRVRRTSRTLYERDADMPDDFAAAGIRGAADLSAQFERCFFGCEADDVSVPWAFDPALGTTLHPIFGSDIGHFDVADMSEVLGEAYELLEHRRLSAEQFREFTYLNVARLHTRMNPAFFAGTVIEQTVRKDLGLG
jgi:predicted TIM-barrel fold metal-dependent hydrolase